MGKLKPLFFDFSRAFVIFLTIRLILAAFSENGIQAREFFLKQVPVALLFALLLTGLRLMRRAPARKTPEQQD